MTEQVGLCPQCASPLDFRFMRKFANIAHMVYDNEWVSLEPFPVQVFCAGCPYEADLVGCDFTIDMDAGVVLFGRILTGED